MAWIQLLPLLLLLLTPPATPQPPRYTTLPTCLALLDATRPSPSSYYYPWSSKVYRDGSLFGSRSSFASFITLDNASASVSIESASTAQSASAPVAPRSPKRAFSETNNQVSGVDEADIVKSNGKYIIAVAGKQLVIIRPGSVTNKGGVTSRVDLGQYLGGGGSISGAGGTVSKSSSRSSLDYSFGAPATFTGTDLFISGSNIIIIGQARDSAPVKNQYYQSYLGTRTAQRVFPTVVVLVLDIRNVKSPRLVASHVVEGQYATARLAGGFAYLVMGQEPYLDQPTNFDLESAIKKKQDISESQVMPLIRTSKSSKIDDDTPWKPLLKCNQVGYLPGYYYTSMITVVGINTKSGAFVGADSVLAPFTYDSPAVVGYPTSLYIAMKWNKTPPSRFSVFEPIVPFRSSGPSTVVLAFSTKNGRVKHRATGEADGEVLNQYSMDEYKGVLRVAVTAGFPTTSGVITYNAKTMKKIGQIRGLAPGERIFSARFIENRAYMVTFRQVDPLFVINLANPAKPRLLGELKIPGFSDYLHPLGNDKLLGFGKGGTDDGVITGLKVAVFDASDPRNPKQQGVLELGGPGSESEVLDDAKALLYSTVGVGAGEGWFVFPVQLDSTEVRCRGGGGEGGGERVFLGAKLVKVDVKGGGLEVVHGWEHVQRSSQGEGCYAYCPAGVVKRAVFVGDVVYTLADGSVVAMPRSKALGGGKPKQLWRDTLFKTVSREGECNVYV